MSPTFSQREGTEGPRTAWSTPCADRGKPVSGLLRGPRLARTVAGNTHRTHPPPRPPSSALPSSEPDLRSPGSQGSDPARGMQEREGQAAWFFLSPPLEESRKPLSQGAEGRAV